VDGLERCGVLRRERSTVDRRAVLVALTPEGRRRLYERLDPREREQSEHLLRHLAELIGEL
jgi:DNA-binding MarR family transcriptional regulator